LKKVLRDTVFSTISEGHRKAQRFKKSRPGQEPGRSFVSGVTVEQKSQKRDEKRGTRIKAIGV